MISSRIVIHTPQLVRAVAAESRAMGHAPDSIMPIWDSRSR